MDRFLKINSIISNGINKKSIVRKIKTEIKEEKAYKKVCREKGRPLDAVDKVNINFVELDVSARTVNKQIDLNKQLLEGPFKDIMRYVIHEVAHVFQQENGEVNEGSADKSGDDYLDDDNEEEAFGFQIDYMKDHCADSEINEYLEQLLDHHKIFNKKDRKEKIKDLIAGEQTFTKTAVPSDVKVLKQLNLKELKKANPPPKDKTKIKEYYADLNERSNHGPKFDSLDFTYVEQIKTKLTNKQLLAISNDIDGKIVSFLIEIPEVESSFIDWLIKHYKILEGGYTVNFITDIYDFFRTSDESAQEVLSYEPDRALRAVQVYHNNLSHNIGNGKIEQKASVIKEYGDVKLVELKTMDELEEEGRLMGHCVGDSERYYEGIQNGILKIYSLRTVTNPHVTFELNVKNQGLDQIKGKQNMPPIDKYLPIVKKVIVDMGWNPLGQDFSAIKWGKEGEEGRYLKNIAENIVNSSPTNFFSNRLNEYFPELEQGAAENLADSNPISFMKNKLYSKYPDLVKLVAEDIAINYSSRFFQFDYLKDRFPKLAEKVANILIENGDMGFFHHDLHQKYPHYIKNKEFIKDLSKDPDIVFKFFDLKLHKIYPDLAKNALYLIIHNRQYDVFFRNNLQDDYPNEALKLIDELFYGRWMRPPPGTYSVNYFLYFEHSLHKDPRYKKYGELFIMDLLKNDRSDIIEQLQRNYNIAQSYPNINLKVASRKDLIYKLAGIRENLIKKYPDLKKYILEVEHKIDKKYLTWFTKQLVNFENKQSGAVRLYDYIIEFKNHQQLLENKDLHQYNFQSLQKAISEIKKQKHEAREVAKQYFELLKQKREEYRNLNMDRKKVRAKSYEDGRKFLNNIEPKSFQSFVRQEISKVIEEREKAKGTEKTARENSDIIFEDENYLVVLPGTIQASKYFGSGTQWCTSGEENNMFVTYSSKNIYLYYIINKENDDKYAYVAVKKGSNINVDIRDIKDVKIDEATLSEALGEYYDKIVPAIKQDNKGREETKFEELLKTMSPEELKQNLDSKKNKIDILIKILEKTERDDTKQFADKELRPIAEKWAESESESENVNFFDYKLYKTYPELGEVAAEKLAKSDGHSFFLYGLHYIYPEYINPELGRMLAEKWAKEGNVDFWNHDLHKTYPELGRMLAEKWAKEGNIDFFRFGLENDYLELAKELTAKLAIEELDPDGLDPDGLDLSESGIMYTDSVYLHNLYFKIQQDALSNNSYGDNYYKLKWNQGKSDKTASRFDSINKIANQLSY